MSRPVVMDPIGGQAVIEGVMMRSNAGVSVAVRSPQGEIVVRYLPMTPWRERHRVLKWPLVRGVTTLFESVSVGIKMLEESASIALGEEPGSQGAGSALSLILGLALAIGLFAVLPAWFYTHLPQLMASPAVAGWLEHLGPGPVTAIRAAILTALGRSVLEGLLRLVLFVGYLAALGTIPDIKRLFEYHGAEHQVIKCHEAGLALEPVNARTFSPLHPRCGTSFLLVTALISILVFAFIPQDLALLERVGAKIALLPVVAGLSYELIRLAGRAGREQDTASWPARLALWVTTPGLWLQRITTRPARDEMLEVAIASLRGALDASSEPIVP